MIPSAYFLFANSPLNNVNSSYDSNRWMLSSGGNGPIQLGSTATAVSANTLRIVAFVGEGLDAGFKTLKNGISVTNGNTALGTITGLDPTTHEVTLSSNSLTPGTSYSPDFKYPLNDHYITKITNLWYSWATYYQNLPAIKNFATQTLTANVSADSDSPSDFRVLTFTGTAPILPLGTRVRTLTGVQPLVTIMKVATVNGVTTYYLSQPLATGGQQQLMFSKPSPITYAPRHRRSPSISTRHRSPRRNSPTSSRRPSTRRRASTARPTPGPRCSPGRSWPSRRRSGATSDTCHPKNYVNISADARDLAKSALRGVPNYNTTPESGWYPKPSEGTGNQTYNVFNLDPYVWFVHKELKLSGYGFSFDDDTADVNANDATTLSIDVGGVDSLTNQVQFAVSAPYGTVHSLATIDASNPSVISLSSKVVYNQVLADDKVNAVTGAYVSGHYIQAGTNLKATAIIDQNQFILSQPAVLPAGEKSVTVKLTFSGKPLH